MNTLQNLDPALYAVLMKRNAIQNATTGALPTAANGGSIARFCSGGSSTCFARMYALCNLTQPKFLSSNPSILYRCGVHRSTIEPYTPGRSIGSNGGMAKGGLPQKYHDAAPEGHHPEFVTGLTGYYAHGRGTGQSDDIPAMLHDGDYVIDADSVAQLGDGSSKAGALALHDFQHQVPHHQKEGGQPVPAKIADGEYVFPASFVTALGGGDNKAGAKMLDKMREELRAHKRAAPTSKIPPKAKSPIEYLKMAKG
jgi:hypothetical protein